MPEKKNVLIFNQLSIHLVCNICDFHITTLLLLIMLFILLEDYLKW